MTPEQKAGQVLMPVLRRHRTHEAQAATIERLHLAGSIIMGDNVPVDAREAGGPRGHGSRRPPGSPRPPAPTAGPGPG